MGFLDRLVHDMLKESTGYDLRKVTRLVGGKNLLMLGAGAAVAGGAVAATQRGQQGPSTGPSSWPAPSGPPSAAPPPPPVPVGPPATSPRPAGSPAGREVPPPPPLPPQVATPGPSASSSPPPATPGGVAPPEEAAGSGGEVPISPELTFALVRTMVAAALADGDLDDREKEMIHQRLGESGLPADRVQQIHRDLVIPPSPAELARLTDVRSEHEAMYRFAGLLILADGQVSDLERAWLDRLATAFGFEADAKAALEGEIFA